MSGHSSLEVATLGGGCYWCLEAAFEQVRGVISVESGFAGGHVLNPTYQQVCQENTGHAEVVQVRIDPKVISFRELLEIFFAIHDPTTLNRQGNDVGPQYRSVIFTHSPEQELIARSTLAELNRAGVWTKPIVTEVAPMTEFYKAEEYHQEYFRKNPMQPYCALVISPKVARFREQFGDRLKV